MNQKQFQKFIDRDEVMVDAGYLDDTAVPQHRIGRGHGGSKRLALLPSNVIVFSSARNGLIESDFQVRMLAREMGWSLERWEEPEKIPVKHATRGWIMLDDSYNWTHAPEAIWRRWVKERRYDGH